MDLGIAMSWFNQRYFRDKLSMFCEFVPQIIFLNGLFGYLCLLIIGKWVSGSTADLYHILIYMFLSPGDAGLTCNGDCEENRMFAGQGALQVNLLLSIPSLKKRSFAIGLGAYWLITSHQVYIL